MIVKLPGFRLAFMSMWATRPHIGRWAGRWIVYRNGATAAEIRKAQEWCSVQNAIQRGAQLPVCQHGFGADYCPRCDG